MEDEMAKSNSRQYVLWGFHPNYGGPLGIVPIKISGGTLRQVRGDYAQRERDDGWTLGIYLEGDEPVGLRLQCAERFA
jgi:hypothetical protein